jgi:hypothetical protein
MSNTDHRRAGKHVVVVASALLVGACTTFAFLISGPLLPLVFAFLLTRSRWRKHVLGPYILGAGITGVWFLLPALTNTDPAVTYPTETGIAPLAGFAIVTFGGAVVTFMTLRQRRQ